ncbi:MAG TPA: AAA domain-containing protein, partial [Hyphomicrobiaceae bacterium]
MRINRPRLPLLTDLYELDDQYVVAPVRERLRAGLVTGIARATREPVLVKYWSKTETALDADLRDVWRRETRLADRIRARPGADDVLVPVLDTPETRDAFSVIMPGEWTPLAAKRSRAGQNHWLRNLNSPRSRRILWRNASRMAAALDAIHGQKVVHGDLTDACIFTASDHEADFRVGGFEFCIRIGEDGGRLPTNEACSFVDDWRRLGGLLRDLLGLQGLEGSPEWNVRAPALALSPNEQALLRALVTPLRDGHFDRRRLGEVLAAIEKESAADRLGDLATYVMGVDFSRASAVPRAIAEATDACIGLDDTRNQLSFIRDDIEAGGHITQLSNGATWALGETLAYRLKPFGTEESPWRGVTTDYARPRETINPGRSVLHLLPQRPALDLVAAAAVRPRLSALGAGAGDWSGLVASGEAEDNSGDGDIQRVQLLTEVALALSSVVEAIPVDVVDHKNKSLWLAPSEDSALGRLRTALGVVRPHEQMRRIFELEQGDIDADWELRESPGFGGRQQGARTVVFDRHSQRDEGPCYQFRVLGKGPAIDFLYLCRSSSGASTGVVQRRLRMLSALATQKELQATLKSPEAALRSLPCQPVAKDRAYAALDESKQRALDAIWPSAPLMATVGPPGVGKTHLLSDIVRRVLEEDPSRRVLITAQGHQALDNAGTGLVKTLSTADVESELIVARSRAERVTGRKDLYPAELSAKYLERLKASSLFASAPPDQQSTLSAMCAAAKLRRAGNDTGHEYGRELRSFESVVLQAANVLLSTSNASDLTRLVEKGAAFDWVIVEEAAKATGCELVAPLLLAMRRLMIGDHDQLPAFDSDRLLAFFGDVGRVRAALKESEAVVGSLFGDHGLDELVEIADDEVRLARICAAARQYVELFKSIVERGRERNLKYPGAQPLAIELTIQHRMHPVICDVVSEAFYDGKLTTFDKTARKFAEGPPPFTFVNQALPQSPIVWVD